MVETQLFPFITENDYKEHEEVNESGSEKLLGADYLRLASCINHIFKEKEDITIHEAIKDKILEREDAQTEIFIDSMVYLAKKDVTLVPFNTTNYPSEICKNDSVISINYCFMADLTG